MEVDSVREDDPHHLPFDISPEARPGEAEVPDRARSEFVSRERPMLALAIEPRSQRSVRSRPDEPPDLALFQKPARALVKSLDHDSTDGENPGGGTEQTGVTRCAVARKGPSIPV